VNNTGAAARLLDLGLCVPELLLPRFPAVDLSAWAVIACDQFTQDPAYWERVRELVGDKPSALNLIFPEVYLTALSGHAAGTKERIAAIHRAMASYLAGDVFAPPLRGGMYVQRDTPYHKGRRGLVLALDLECYDWGAQARTLIRATEDTAPERLPPRMDIRRGAPLESPHVLLLLDDPEDGLLGGLAGLLDSAPAYRGSLMLDSGAVTGWPVDREEQWAFIASRLEAKKASMAKAAAEQAPTGKTPGAPFLYAVGDGNHSLAGAKGVWEEYKQAHAGEPGLMAHPGRFALAEIENLYDPAITFEPIHRIVFNADMDALLGALDSLPGLNVSPLGDLEQLCRLVGDRGALRTRMGLISGARLLLVETGAPGLATAALQPLLDRFVRGGPARSIDYIHGGEELIRLAAGPASASGGPERVPPGKGAVGILLPPIRKEGLFETVARSGPLPRKSFSMGESVEKRFYLECRRLY
jgi:hypothetical protein